MADGYIFGNKFDSKVGRSVGQYFQIGRVKSIVLGPYKGNTKERDPDYGSPIDIGKIKYELMYSSLGTSKSGEVSEPAWPMFNFMRQYPVVNEIVFIIAGPTEKLNDRVSNQQYFYFPPYSLWNRANHGAFPNMSEYSQFLSQYNNVQGYSGNAVTGSSLPLGYTFQENQQVRNLQPFEGDTIVQARFGQSIRFGSTVPVMKSSNTWSNSGANGDPITIILNSQRKENVGLKFNTIVEDINKDGSAIYMTSTQEIFLEDVNNFPLNSFGVPITPVSQPVVRTIPPPISNEVLAARAQDAASAAIQNRTR
jgi:hypothetical protein